MRHKAELEVIETARYAAVVRAFMAKYPNAVAKLDGKVQSEKVSEWCTNTKLKSANNFSLRAGDLEVLGFHDGPQRMWAPGETMSLLKELVAKKVMRLGRRPAPSPSGIVGRLLGRK
jgi:hypothetical protein